MKYRTEDLIINQLILNKSFMEKVFPFIQYKYFTDDLERKIVKFILRFWAKYHKQPTWEIVNIYFKDRESSLLDEEKERIVEIIGKIQKLNSSDISDEYLLDTTESFCQEHSMYNALSDSIELFQSEKNKSSQKILGLVEKASSVFFDFRVGHNYTSDFEERLNYYKSVDIRHETHLKRLNEAIGGGFTRKTISVVLGQPGSGKSRFLVDLGMHYLKQGMNVLYITLELSEMVIAQRCDANLLDLNINEIPDMDAKLLESKVNFLKKKAYGRLFIKEYPTGSASVLHFSQLISELKAKQNFVPDVLIVDYLSIAKPAKDIPYHNTFVYSKLITEELRSLAVQTNTMLFTAGQLNRAGWNTSDADMKNVAESAGIIFTADFVMAIMTNDDLLDQNQIAVKVLKNRLYMLSGVRRFLLGFNDLKMNHYDVDPMLDQTIDSTPSIDDRVEKTDDVAKKFENFNFS